MKLFTTVLSSLRSYNDLIVLDKSMSSRMRHRMGLTLISETSDSLFSAAGMEELLAGIHTVILKLLSGNGKEALSSFTALQDNSEFRVVDARGRFQNTAGSDVKKLVGDEVFRSLQTLKERNCNLLVHNDSVYLYEDTLDSRFLVCIVDVHRLELQDRQLLDIFASNVSMAFENLRLNREITGTQEELITRLSEVVETRSHDTAQHVRRVGLFCELIAGKYGMKETLIHDLKLASTMHDIGKIGIPDEILLKPGLLTEDEFTVVKTHTEIGYRLLKRSSRPLLKTAAQICLEHHERYDGTGYPKGIMGDEIIINARIVSICDVFDSITHGRLHREPWDFDRASEYLRVEKAGAFDPDLVDLFLENPDLVVQINHDFPD
jgi:response regulator RpfG family c-di-GMP phosphodiesterase